MKMMRKLNFNFVENTLYKIEYHWPGRTEKDKRTVIAAYVKTDEKFHYLFKHPYNVNSKTIEAESIGIRTQEFHSILPVSVFESSFWKHAVNNFISSNNNSSHQMSLENLNNMQEYNGEEVYFDFQKIRENHYRTEPLDYEAVYNNIVTGMCSYVNTYHLDSFVLGISGGIDSTVVAALACEVSKRTGCKLIGISLMTSTNENDEVDAADCVGKEFCTSFNRVQMTEEYVVMNNLCTTVSGPENNISSGNVKARMRMLVLYDAAQKHHGIVLDTDNLPEHNLGFFTVHGDVADFNPIGFLWKHEVYGLANWMLENIYPNSEALKKSIALTPTDGNGVQAGGDMAQIAPGHTYEDVDDILMTYIEFVGHHTEEYQIEMEKLYEKYGYDTVERVIKRHKNSEFKRRHAPLVVDIFDSCILENDGKLVY